MMSKILFYCIVSLLIFQMGFAQTSLKVAEDSLQYYFSQLFLFNGTKYIQPDSTKKDVNQKIVDLLQSLLNDNASLEYNFTNLDKLSQLHSKNRDVNIYTWDTQFANHSHIYHGFIQYYNKKKKRLVAFPLIDRSDSLNDILKRTLKAEDWYGVLYYQMIPVKVKNRTYYTLIGFDSNNLLVSKKVIDVLYFTSAGQPRFGKRLFLLGKEKKNRVIFQFSAKVSMLLRFDFKYDMIVADHLSPNSPSLKGIYQFYGPDFKYQGFKFEEGKWVLYDNISVKNPKDKK